MTVRTRSSTRDREAPDDPRAPARGILVGLALSFVAFWLPVGGAVIYLLARRR